MKIASLGLSVYLLAASLHLTCGQLSNLQSPSCTEAIKEYQAGEDKILQDAFLMVDGKPLPNLENHAVAYAHQKHCEEVLTKGPDPMLDDAMNKMHLAHCEKMNDDAVQSIATTKVNCALEFPFTETKNGEIGSLDYLRNGWVGTLDYFLNSADLPVVSFTDVVTYNFVEILKKEYNGSDMTPAEEAYVNFSHSDKTKLISGKAHACL